MRKNQIDKLLVTAYLLCLSACAPHRTTEIQRREIHDTGWIKQDCLFRSGRNEQTEALLMDWQQIHLSPPDSSGRQYVESMIHASAVRERQEITEDSTYLESIALSSVRNEKEEKQKTTSTSRTTGRWMWLLIAIAWIGLWKIATKR